MDVDEGIAPEVDDFEDLGAAKVVVGVWAHDVAITIGWEIQVRVNVPAAVREPVAVGVRPVRVAQHFVAGLQVGAAVAAGQTEGEDLDPLIERVWIRRLVERDGHAELRPRGGGVVAVVVVVGQRGGLALMDQVQRLGLVRPSHGADDGGHEQAGQDGDDADDDEQFDHREARLHLPFGLVPRRRHDGSPFAAFSFCLRTRFGRPPKRPACVTKATLSARPRA